MTDIETIRTLTGNNEISDGFITFHLDSAEKFIKSYCNISIIPEGLKPTLLEIVAFRVKANSSGEKATIGEGVKVVTGITDGNQTVNYSARNANSYTTWDDILAAFGAELTRWRKMVVQRQPEPYIVPTRLGPVIRPENSFYTRRYR